MMQCFFLITILLFSFIQVYSECKSNAAVWTYYPCSFMISTESFVCPNVSMNLTIDQCINREMILFWHYPFGNMSLTLQSKKNEAFLLRLSKASSLIKNIYHLINNQTIEERLIYDNEIMTLYSDKSNQCSIKFETINRNIFDYGTFIRMTVLTDEEKRINF